MPIIFHCPSCHRRLKGKDELAGQTLACPNPDCKTSVTVPKTASELIAEAKQDRIMGPGVALTLLWVPALQEGRVDLLEELVARGIQTLTGQEMLGAALHGSSVEGMKWLKNKGVGVDVRNDENQTPLHLLVNTNAGDIRAIEWLVKECNVDVNARCNKGRTPMISAASVGRIDGIKCLAKMGADVNARCHSGLSAIHYASGSGAIESIKCLVALGADVNAKDNNGLTPIFYTLQDGQIECIKCLAGLGADVNARLDDGRTPVFVAVERGLTESIRCLVEMGADINAMDNNGMTPMISAVMGGQVECVKCLASLKVDVNAKFANGMTVMHFAAATGQIASMKCLKGLGAKTDAKDNNGQTPRDIAISENQAEAARWLSANVATSPDARPKPPAPSAVDRSYQSSFKDIFEAARKGTVEDVRYFVEQKDADVNAKNQQDNIPLFDAVSLNSIEVVKYLIFKGANVNVTHDASGGLTPLHIAVATNKSVDVLEYLISHGADVDATDNNGMTPLHVAAASDCSVALLKCLISHGADVFARTNLGYAPRHLAGNAGNEEKKRILFEAS